MNSKIKTYIGFALNKGDVIFGLDNIKKCKKPPKLVVMDNDVSEKTKKEVTFYCGKFGAKLVQCNIPIQEVVAKSGVKVLAMTDSNLIKAILQNLDEDFKCVEVVN